MQHGQDLGPYVIYRAVNRSLYTLLFYLALPIIFLRLWRRSFKDIRYRQRWRERLAYYSAGSLDTSPNSIVFHAVSVGELHAVVPLIKACQEKLPDWVFTITTTTVTGSARVKEIFGDSVQHCYIPQDFPGAVKRFLKVLNPRMLIIMETELWPNLLHYSKRAGCKVMLLNARLSEKSFSNYLKYPALTKSMLLDITCVAAQFEQDGEHFKRLGLPESSLQVCGTVKFDQVLDQTQEKAGHELRKQLGRPILVAGSTRQGEEEKVLVSFKSLLKTLPNLLLILVPRHPERFNEIKDLISSQALQFVTRSSAANIGSDKQVLLGDSMGEMQFYYACGDLAFVGGSLVDTGCQNIIEPAALGSPIVTGPSLYNFKAVSEILLKAGAMLVAKDEEQLTEIVLNILIDEPLRQKMSVAAQTTVAENSGVSSAQLDLILKAIHSGQ